MPTTPLKLNYILTNSSFKPHHLLKIKPPQNDTVLPSLSRMFSPRGGINLVLLNHQHRAQIIGQHHRSHLNLQIVKPVIFSRMAESEKRDNQPPLVAEKEKKEIPPPPEKPEAGDCCGSGCVRCVWDVYYEELEAYNQQLKEFNDNDFPK